jgi:ribosomal-protein-alanine N-acetyltransferase
MWPPVNFEHELNNRLARYLVVSNGNSAIKESQLKPQSSQIPKRTFLGFNWPFSSRTAIREGTVPGTVEHISGFVGLWIMMDEAHIINIAVSEPYRGQGIGELLLIAGIDTAAKLQAGVVTLEVRESNRIAQNLYTKYGFIKVGVRKGYYTDNREDALIMTTDNIVSDSFKRHLQSLKEVVFQKLERPEYQIA